MERLYESVQPENPELNGAVQALYKEWLGGPASEQTRDILHTGYHAVEKSSATLNIKW